MSIITKVIAKLKEDLLALEALPGEVVESIENLFNAHTEQHASTPLHVALPDGTTAIVPSSAVTSAADAAAENAAAQNTGAAVVTGELVDAGTAEQAQDADEQLKDDAGTEVEEPQTQDAVAEQLTGTAEGGVQEQAVQEADPTTGTAEVEQPAGEAQVEQPAAAGTTDENQQAAAQ